jgi:hypothetical protein
MVAMLLWAGASGAEIRRIEEIGAVPIRSSERGADARDAALQAALQEAVGRVARSFLMDVDPSSGSASDPEAVDLNKVLGKRMVPYTTRFRVLQDKGERPAMFAEKGAATEYVLVVEVFVDADRVEQRLMDAGLLERDAGAGEVRLIELELRGLKAYGALQAVRTLLTERIGAKSAVPLQFEKGVAVLEVELPGADADPAELSDQLASLGPPELLIRPLEVDAQRAVLDITWRPSADSKGRGTPGSR